MPSSSATFGPQWPRHNPNIVTLVRKDGLRIPLHRALVPLVSMLMQLTEAMGYDLIPGWCWGFAWRNIAGTNSPSNHSRGCAVDLNAPKNPMASAAWHIRNWTRRIFGLKRHTDIPQAVVELWEAHGFYSGVRYLTRPDPMHMEFTETLTECALITARLQKQINHPDWALPQPSATNPPPPAQIPVPEEGPNMAAFFARQSNTQEVFFFEDGRYTHMQKQGDVNELARQLGISPKEADVGMATWASLTKGRAKYL